MKIAFKNIHGGGELTRERIVLAAVENCDIGDYAILAARRGSTPQTVEGGPVRQCFWWPDKQVRGGDLVVLYTKKGTASVKQNPSGSTSHFFYWDLDECVWKEDRVAVLIEIGKKWSQFAVAEEEAMEEMPPSTDSVT